MNYLSEFGSFARELAKASGDLILRYFRTEIAVDDKADASPVTVADRGAEEIMRKLIMKRYPEHGIVGEEFGSYNETAEFKWVLDPIDGTKSFICGTPTFATLIALAHKEQPVLGIIHQPVLKDLLIGDNQVCLWNEKPVKIRDTSELKKAVTLVTDILHVEEHQSWAGFHSLMKQTRFTRTWGDAYGYFLIATGQAHIMVDPILNTWDLMALIPIIRGAGGCITDYQGANPVTANSIVAAVPGLHGKVIQILNEKT